VAGSCIEPSGAMTGMEFRQQLIKVDFSSWSCLENRFCYEDLVNCVDVRKPSVTAFRIPKMFTMNILFKTITFAKAVCV